MSCYGKSRSSDVIALGFGIDTAILGVKYQKQFESYPLVLGMGLGVEGLAPSFQHIVSNHSWWNIYWGSTVLFSWGGLIFQKGVIPGLSAGIQFWPIKSSWGLYLHTGVFGFCLVNSGAEGGARPGSCSSGIHLQMGVVF